MHVPFKLTVVDVGPRDGFQNIRKFIPTDVKRHVIDLIIASGVKKFQVTSFVHPKAIPQMADAKEVATYVLETYGNQVEPVALIPNLRGAENAVICGIPEVAYVISASASHNRANVNRTIDESCEELEKIIRAFPDLKVSLDVATAFGCPFEGPVVKENVFALMDRAIEAGVHEITLCDTIGVANPAQVEELSTLALERYQVPVALHLHDTRGMGLANTLAGMMSGITIFETSVAGLGGCPFAPGAAGNTATEDMLNMLQEMGIETGIDLDTYMKAVAYIRESVQSVVTSHMANVCKSSV